MSSMRPKRLKCLSAYSARPRALSAASASECVCGSGIREGLLVQLGLVADPEDREIAVIAQQSRLRTGSPRSVRRSRSFRRVTTSSPTATTSPAVIGFVRSQSRPFSRRVAELPTGAPSARSRTAWPCRRRRCATPRPVNPHNTASGPVSPERPWTEPSQRVPARWLCRRHRWEPPCTGDWASRTSEGCGTSHRPQPARGSDPGRCRQADPLRR
jgi:hypothetical protein